MVPHRGAEHADVLASGKVACSPSSPRSPGSLRLRAAPRALWPVAVRVGTATGVVDGGRVPPAGSPRLGWRGLGGAGHGGARRARMSILPLPHNKEGPSVRATTLLTDILGMKHTRVEAVAFDEQGVVVDVAPTTTIPRCSGCFCRVDKGYDARQRSWRHLDLAGMRVVLRYELRRVDCPRCGVRIELVPWAEPDSWFTRDFEEHTAYLAQTTDKTTVVTTMRVAWRTVGEIARRVVDRVQRGDPLDGLKQIGVDDRDVRRLHQGRHRGLAAGDDHLRPLPRPAAGTGGRRRGSTRRGAREPGDRRGQGAQTHALHPAQEPLEPDQPRRGEARGVAAHQQAHLPRLHAEGGARGDPGWSRRRCRTHQARRMDPLGSQVAPRAEASRRRRCAAAR